MCLHPARCRWSIHYHHLGWWPTTIRLIQSINAMDEGWNMLTMGNYWFGWSHKNNRHQNNSSRKLYHYILQHEHMECANPVATPLDPNVKIRLNPEGNEGSWSNSFAKLLGELQFLPNATRPDIAHTINRLAAYTANPSLQHTGALKQVLRYLAGTKSYGIT